MHDTKYPTEPKTDYLVSANGIVSNPNLRNFKYNPLRVRPRERAASEILPLLWCSVASIISRSRPSTAGAGRDGQARRRARTLADSVPDRRGRNFRREVLRTNPLARAAERHEALDLITELTDIARPPMLRKQLERVGREEHVGLAEPLRNLAHEQTREMRYFFAPIAERRNQNSDSPPAGSTVLAELASATRCSSSAFVAAITRTSRAADGSRRSACFSC